MRQCDLVFSKESFDAVMSEAVNLLEQHRSEISLFPDVQNDPDIDTYRIMEARGALHVYVARRAGQIVGYVSYIVHRNLHYNLQCASQDLLYLHPENRKGRAGLMLIKFSEEDLKNMGVDVITQHTKDIRNLSGLFSYLGYRPMDTIFYKRL